MLYSHKVIKLNRLFTLCTLNKSSLVSKILNYMVILHPLLLRSLICNIFCYQERSAIRSFHLLTFSTVVKTVYLHHSFPTLLLKQIWCCLQVILYTYTFKKYKWNGIVDN